MGAIKRGAIWGIVALIAALFFIISSFLTAILGIVGSVVSLILMALSILGIIMFYYGFIVLARIKTAKLLKVTSWINSVLGVIVLIIIVILSILALFSGANFEPGLSPTTFNVDLTTPKIINDVGVSEPFASLLAVFAGLIIFAVVVGIAIAIIQILFGVGLLKLKEELPIAKAAGIVHIIAVGLVITIILAILGWIVWLIAYIIEIILLFQASKKYES